MRVNQNFIEVKAYFSFVPQIETGLLSFTAILLIKQLKVV